MSNKTMFIVYGIWNEIRTNRMLAAYGWVPLAHSREVKHEFDNVKDALDVFSYMKGFGKYARRNF
jgi:hypothetical protein